MQVNSHVFDFSFGDFDFIWLPLVKIFKITVLDRLENLKIQNNELEFLNMGIYDKFSWLDEGVREIILSLKSTLKQSQQLTTRGSSLITEQASSRSYPYFYEFESYNKLCERQEPEHKYERQLQTWLNHQFKTPEKKETIRRRKING